MTSESHVEHLKVVGAGARRGVILHKLMEELLTGELAGELGASVSRARELLDQLVSDVNDDEPRPDPNEMAAAAFRGLALPEIAELRPHLVPEIAIWGRAEVGLPAALTLRSIGNLTQTLHLLYARHMCSSFMSICPPPAPYAAQLSI